MQSGYWTPWGSMSKTSLDKYNIAMGLVLSRGVLFYGFEHGAFQGWPMWFKRPVVRVWNRTHCFFFGHDKVGLDLAKAFPECRPAKCINCCATIKEK